MGEIRDGAALFARRAGVPRAVYLQYSEHCWPRGMPFPIPGAKLRVFCGGYRLRDDLPRRQQDAYISNRCVAGCRKKDALRS